MKLKNSSNIIVINNFSYGSLNLLSQNFLRLGLNILVHRKKVCQGKTNDALKSTLKKIGKLKKTRKKRKNKKLWVNILIRIIEPNSKIYNNLKYLSSLYHGT